ncbi:MAG: sulfurtransferase TusA family protein [Acidobacteriota bacterium]|nr:sulfurtransferase TusA family protein [Acidobacteriota bacterium]MDQ2978750.1 sulfurtransferase TusA family protein [Acidobacteriota bacterium]
MKSPEFEEALLVDARGLYCPLPVLRLAAALQAGPLGARARLLATDPEVVPDVDSYCRETGAKLLSRREESGVFMFEIEKSIGDKS